METESLSGLTATTTRPSGLTATADDDTGALRGRPDSRSPALGRAGVGDEGNMVAAAGDVVSDDPVGAGVAGWRGTGAREHAGRLDRRRPVTAPTAAAAVSLLTVRECMRSAVG
jgi:hypothetical protein